MYTGKTLNELITTVVEQAKTKRDHIVDTRQIRYVRTRDGSLRLAVADLGGYVMNEWAERQIQQYTKIRSDYYDRCRDEIAQIGDNRVNLLDTQVNHWLTKAEERRMIRTYRVHGEGDDIARAFLSDRYRVIDNEDLLEIIIPELMPLAQSKELIVQSCDVTMNKMYLKCSLPNVVRPIKLNDEVEMGFVIGNSEVGDGTAYILPWVLRKVCANGMIIEKHGLKKYHIGKRILEQDYNLYADDTLKADDTAFGLQVRDMVRAFVSERVIDDIVADMQEAQGIEVKRPPKAVETLKSKWSLSDEQHDSILLHFLSGKDPAGLSYWGLCNAVTRAAEDQKDYDTATEFERLGGVLLNLPAAERRQLVEAK